MEKKEEMGLRPTIVVYGSAMVNNYEIKEVHIGTLNMSDMADRIASHPKNGGGSDSVRQALVCLFEEGAVTESKQWYAIYCVLSQCAGYPTVMTEFCEKIDELQLDVNPPCVYENWRKVQNELSFLPKNVKMWNPDNPQMNPTQKTKANKQIATAVKLLQLLGEI